MKSSQHGGASCFARAVVGLLWLSLVCASGCARITRNAVRGGVDGIIEQRTRGNLPAPELDIEGMGHKLSRGLVDGALDRWDVDSDERVARIHEEVDRFVATLKESAVTLSEEAVDKLKVKAVELVDEVLDEALHPRHRRDVEKLVAGAAHSFTTVMMEDLGRGIQDDVGPALANTLRDDVGPALQAVLRDDVNGALGDGAHSMGAQAVFGVDEALSEVVERHRMDPNSFFAKVDRFLDRGGENLQWGLLIGMALLILTVIWLLILRTKTRLSEHYATADRKTFEQILELVTKAAHKADAEHPGAMDPFLDRVKGLARETTDKDPDWEKVRGELNAFLKRNDCRIRRRTPT